MSNEESIVLFEGCFNQIETTQAERKCSSVTITESDEKQTYPVGLESIERASSSLPFSSTVLYGSGRELGADGGNGIMDMDRLLQQTMILSTDADFMANRILQRVPMNLMNGSSQGLVPISTTEDVPGSSSVSVFSSTTLTARNSSKTLKCPKCNWHYKYQETLEIHMKEKHAGHEVKCIFCLHNRPHPRLARGESYSCGYKPYRCEICKYSTTTKGNLSIHMQSDKHLHAVQEIPPTVTGNTIAISSGDLNTENLLQCMICSTYSTDNISKMIEHIEKDRSHPVVGDISLIHGVYHCNLCPYSTNLKANFQLHTRTDKHVQRTQTVSELQF
ncbi:unnamed protein product [Cercopithifilaria johnstoni]|uniref:C2H2-type domain-containing protein n=1 Tax=Cercopithifilaria johnstoni TaxID=2874296 RepID=A0A8J2M420_9BILA|nr:unnamed protein product [Cercopithifilaria johnstoni]